MKIRKAVIPAAGFGTRFLPATKSQPKEMLPVIDKPLIQYCVEEAVQAGIENIAVITSRGKSSLEDYFDQIPELEQFLEEKKKLDFLEEVRRISKLAEFAFIRQKQALGLGHAILMAKSYIGQEPFAVLLPDDIFDCPKPCIQQLGDSFSEFKATFIVLGRVDKEGTKKYGIVKPKQVSERVFQIEDMIEKPGPEKAFSDLGILGRYVFTPGIFEVIKKTAPDKKGEIQITDAIKLLLAMQPVYGYLFEGKRYDAGDKFGFLQATIELALKRPEFSQDLRKYLESLRPFTE
ncbi:MAG: UTP--glucose-1-phosphate uridylyltransferase GalU [Candidatus Aminicenantes bacterium]|nr:MAG: UTP--glucose-1-phosphate uridylyltransferase GalU [Candidatus Aminicenantes bacterium]